jgi:hypothetical protein
MRAGLAVKLCAEYQHFGAEFAGRRSFLTAGLNRRLSTAASSFLAAADRSFICQGSRARPTATI